MERKTTYVLIMALMTFFVLIARPPTSHGAIMTFDSIDPCEFCGIESGGVVYGMGEYIEDGIKMSLVADHYDFGLGNVNIDTHISGGTLKFEMADGSLFNLSSLNVWTSPLDPLFLPYSVAYKLSYSNGNSLFLDPGTNMLLSLGINNLSYFTASIYFSSGFAEQHNFTLDNINMTSIPEPSTLFLLGSGLVGLAGYGRRRFRK